MCLVAPFHGIPQSVGKDFAADRPFFIYPPEVNIHELWKRALEKQRLILVTVPMSESVVTLLSALDE